MKSKKNIKNILVTYYHYIILLAFIFIISILTGFNHCYVERTKINDEVIGIVERKFLDSANHNYFTVEIKLTERQYNLEPSHEKYYISGFHKKYSNEYVFDFIQIGDSLVKLKGSNILNVFNDGNKKEFMIDYGCAHQKWKWDNFW